METPSDSFRRVVVLARVRNGERLISSSLLAVLIALLLWQTQWISLRPGLIVLLLVQIAIPFSLLYQNRRISGVLASWETLTAGETEKSAWFDEQIRFAKRLATLENSGRFAGFALLAYGLWVSSHLVWLAVALGLIYPTVIYFGIARASQSRALKELEKQKQQERMRVQSKRAG